MSDRTRKDERWCLHNRVWRVQDDRSGFIDYSTNMIIDHRGRVTRPEYADPIHPFEKPQPIITDDLRVPFARKDPLTGLQPDNPDSDTPGVIMVDYNE